MIPEQYGCDVLFYSRGKSYGIQRKEIKDFLASVEDGRLGKEVDMMGPLEQGMVVVEGKVRYTGDGELVMDRFTRRWTRSAILSLLYSIRARGVWVEWSEDTAGTATVCREFEAWVKKDGHKALEHRPGPRGNSWGRKDNRDYQRHLLQGFPGIDTVRANAILDAIGMPLTWVDDVEEKLMGVKGLGKKTVEKLMKAL